MLRIAIVGTAIGGEDAREAEWVEQIVAASALSQVKLTFRVEQHRKVDLDNLVRPAMRALQKRGFYSRGFPELESLTALKEFRQPLGLTVESETAELPGHQILDVEWDALPPSDRTAQWKHDWTTAIRNKFPLPPLNEPAWLTITTTSRRSLVELLKPIIDGLEPLLGRDPVASNSFSPNDHLIHWLQIRRTDQGVPLRLAAGRLVE